MSTRTTLVFLCTLFLANNSLCSERWTIEKVFADRSTQKLVELDQGYRGSFAAFNNKREIENSSPKDEIEFTHARIFTACNPVTTYNCTVGPALELWSLKF